MSRLISNITYDKIKNISKIILIFAKRTEIMNVFDFDNTIYDGETLIDFALHYVRTDPKIWKYVPKLLIICFKDAFHLFSVEEAIEAYASFLEGYFIHIKTLDEDVIKFWNKNEKKIKPWYNEVRQDDDIIVSGSTDFLLDEIMKRIIGILTLSCLLFSACGKDEIPQEENEKKTEETTPGDDTGGDESDDDPDSPKLVVPLHVEGRYLKNEQGKIVNLHGFTQTYSPYFNNNAWSNYDVSSCLSYNKSMVDKILAAGWKFNFVRLHMDPYWSDDTTLPYVRYEGHERFSETRFKKYLKELFVPMAEYFISKGMYVVMRPPGVCPHAGDTEDNRYLGIELGDSYQEFLLKVWDIVSQNAVVKNNPGIMFELANEPVHIKGTDGKYGGDGDACFINMQKYFQAIVDKIRGNACNNIIWVPGLGWQSQYSGYKDHRIEGENIGFAVHCYPGWYGSDAEQDSGEGNGSSTGGGYEPFQRGWDKQVGPVASFAPVMVTEIDWAPKKYDATWGKSITGVAKGEGFGANFKYIADQSGNVSWLFFTTKSHELAAFKDVAGEPGNYTFLNDPEACPWAIYHWFKEYAEMDE